MTKLHWIILGIVLVIALFIGAFFLGQSGKKTPPPTATTTPAPVTSFEGGSTLVKIKVVGTASDGSRIFSWHFHQGFPIDGNISWSTNLSTACSRGDGCRTKDRLIYQHTLENPTRTVSVRGILSNDLPVLAPGEAEGEATVEIERWDIVPT